MIKRLSYHIAGTFFGVGHIPFIPATWTSLVVALLLYFSGWSDPYLQLGILVLFVAVGIPACSALEREYGEDPRQATMDEAAGMIITLFAVPLDFRVVMLGFVLFRIFDVVKPPPARQLENLHGGMGIMCDDLMAGIYARLVLELFIRYLPAGWL